MCVRHVHAYIYKNAAVYHNVYKGVCSPVSLVECSVNLSVKHHAKILVGFVLNRYTLVKDISSKSINYIDTVCAAN